MNRLRLRLCWKCAELMKDSYDLAQTAEIGAKMKCAHCGKRGYTLEYEVSKK